MNIRPSAAIRQNYNEIAGLCRKTAGHVFLTKNGYGDMVVLSMEAYENLQLESEIYTKLQAAEREAALTETRYSSKDGLNAVRRADEVAQVE